MMERPQAGVQIRKFKPNAQTAWTQKQVVNKKWCRILMCKDLLEYTISSMFQAVELH